MQNQEDAAECVNDTWFGAWKSIPPQRPECLAAYLGKITRNLSLNRWKQYSTQKRGRGQTELVLEELEDCIPDGKDVEQIVEEMALVEALNCFLYGQEEQRRHIFVRRYWYLSPIRDIAEAYGMTESKVTSLLFRMRKELRNYLEKEGISL